MEVAQAEGVGLSTSYRNNEIQRYIGSENEPRKEAMMTETLQRIICSCTQFVDPVDHEDHCDLWNDSSFAEGTSIWDHKYFRLIGFMEWAGLPDHEGVKLTELADAWPALERAIARQEGVAIETTSDYDLDEEEFDEADFAECPQCNNNELQCADCGFMVDDCECPNGIADLYCSKCDIIFELAIEQAEQIDAILDEIDQGELIEIEPKCNCKPPKTYYCATCGVERDGFNLPWNWVEEDALPTGPPTCACKPEKPFYCTICGVTKNGNKDNPWAWSPTVWNINDKGEVTGRKDQGDKYSTTWYKCRHYEAPVNFPDGTTVWASSRFDRKKDEIAPDFGLYLDKSWRPACLAYFIEWPDFGIPMYFEVAADAIVDVFERAQNGQTVEVGCIGGHGRTGTALACMAVLAGVSATDAVTWVHQNYCTEAVESERQEWFVEWFADWVNGTNEAGPMPEYSSPYGGSISYGGNTYIHRSFKVEMDGKEVTCWFEKDWETGKKNYATRDVVRRGNQLYLALKKPSPGVDPKDEANRDTWQPVAESFVPSHILKEHDSKAQKESGSPKATGGTQGATSATCSSSQSATAPNNLSTFGEWLKEFPDHRCRITAKCLRPAMASGEPACNNDMTFGSSKCIKCGLEYAPGFWRHHYEQQANLLKIKEGTSSIKPNEAAPRWIGKQSGDFIWTGDIHGWQHMTVAEHYLTKYGTQSKKESKREKKRRQRREKKVQVKKNNRKGRK